MKNYFVFSHSDSKTRQKIDLQNLYTCFFICLSLNMNDVQYSRCVVSITDTTEGISNFSIFWPTLSGKCRKRNKIGHPMMGFGAINSS